jgi:nitronate monooxygenase
VAEAEWLQLRGADGVIAQGIEAGGHQGRFLAESEGTEMLCLKLVSAVADAVALPVIAAGGIACRDDAVAALAVGATAVQVGSAYLQAFESSTSEIHRTALQSDAAKDTALTNVFSGRRARGIVNRVMRELGPISALPPAFPYAAEAMAPLRSAAEAQGSGDFSPLWSGERGYLSEAKPAADITRAIIPL